MPTEIKRDFSKHFSKCQLIWVLWLLLYFKTNDFEINRAMFIHQSLHYIKTILYIILRMYYIWWKTVFDSHRFDILHFLLKLNFSYFTTIYKVFLQLISISLIWADISSRPSLMWEEAREPGGKPCVQATPMPYYIQPMTITEIVLGLQQWE